MEGLTIDSASAYRGARPRWTRRRSCTGGYQRLPAAPGRAIRLGRRRTTAVLCSAACRLGRLRRRAAARSWASPLRLLSRIVDTYISTMLSRPLEALTKAGVAAAPSSPPKLRRDGSLSGSTRRRDACGRGVVLNICVGEVLLRRTTSEVRRSPLQQPRKPARCTSVRA
ncbi:hypothetical protein BS78_03G189100 [Paspalum vaginatum]|nr:hypothetical protein BS78_03G189100 [Paspalum vaginatum]